MERIVDAGAVVAGWVGLGMALVLAMAFELIIPLQAMVFLLRAADGHPHRRLRQRALRALAAAQPGGHRTLSTPAP